MLYLAINSQILKVAPRRGKALRIWVIYAQVLILFSSCNSYVSNSYIGSSYRFFSIRNDCFSVFGFHSFWLKIRLCLYES